MSELERTTERIVPRAGAVVKYPSIPLVGFLASFQSDVLVLTVSDVSSGAISRTSLFPTSETNRSLTGSKTSSKSGSELLSFRKNFVFPTRRSDEKAATITGSVFGVNVSGRTKLVTTRIRNVGVLEILTNYDDIGGGEKGDCFHLCSPV